MRTKRGIVALSWLGFQAAAFAAPDIIITNISGTSNYASVQVGGVWIDAFSLGTTVCNQGDETAAWTGASNQHAVVRLGLFRLHQGRFEQVGTSWVKHAYPANNKPNLCGGTCAQPDVVGEELRAGCSDTNIAGLNGDRVHTGLVSEVNAFTGEFVDPPTHFVASSTIDQRIQVRHTDLDPILNEGAAYFGQAHLVQPEDALAGNGEDNCSFRNVVIYTRSDGGFDANIGSSVDPTHRGDPVIRAWKEHDPLVVEVDARISGEGLFIAAGKATDLGDGYWQYEYAIQNVNSNRSARSLRIPLPSGALIRNVGFHDVDYHSGETYDGTDWAAVVTANSITWSCPDFVTDFHANALRWSTLYNFRFQANVGPAPSSFLLGLFTPGTPTVKAFTLFGPTLGAVDCNGNDVADRCDVGCSGCAAPCGGSDDCNTNGVPDECEPDCDDNGIADTCDVRDCGVDEPECADCNSNNVPDACDVDCDGDGSPNACELSNDQDEDGVTDCEDECPRSTPAFACMPPNTVTCLLNGFCIYDYPGDTCPGNGVPVCGDSSPCPGSICPVSRCRQGCLWGDFNEDGDVDLRDYREFFVCLPQGNADERCLLAFDVNSDENVTKADYAKLASFRTGPE